MDRPLRSRKPDWLMLLTGLAVGALLMYEADPHLGRQRRAQLQSRLSSTRRTVLSNVQQVFKRARERVSGLRTEGWQGWKLNQPKPKPIDDHVLEARIRSKLAREPQALGVVVLAQHGKVNLSGFIDPEHEQRVLEQVAAIPGVTQLSHSWHSSSRVETSALGSNKAGGRWWVAAAVVVVGLTWVAVRRRQPLGWATALTGLGWLASSDDHRRLGKGHDNPHLIDLEGQVQLAAAPEVVFDVWSHYENFPHFLSHVIEVHDLGPGRTRWILQGAKGVEFVIDAVQSAFERPGRLAWQSESPALADIWAQVVIEACEGGSLATVHLTWRPAPAAGGMPQLILMGDQARQQFEEDLLRMKQFIERGLPAREPSAHTEIGASVLH